MRLLLPAAFTFTCLALCGCGSRDAHGLLFTSDGKMVTSNAVNNRGAAQERIAASIDAEVAPHWRSEVVIAELPEYETSGTSDIGTWRWSKATVSIVMVGDGTAPRKLGDEEILAGVREYLSNKVKKSKENLVITVSERIGPAAAPVATAPAPVAKPAAPAAAGPRTYVVQPGDTLADLSAAFYGSPQHWRRIAEANPGIPAEGLTAPGTTLVIPPAP